MSTTAEVSVSTPTPATVELLCSRCGSPIEAEGEHIELFSRNLVHEILAGYDSVLIGPKKLLPGNRYCVGCSGVVFNYTARNVNVYPDVLTVLVPDTEIGQHLYQIMSSYRSNDNTHSGKTIITLRWIDKRKFVYALWVDHRAGSYQEWSYNVIDTGLKMLSGTPTKMDPVPPLLVASAPENVQALMKDWIPKWTPTKKAEKKPKAAKPSVSIPSPLIVGYSGEGETASSANTDLVDLDLDDTDPEDLTEDQ